MLTLLHIYLKKKSKGLFFMKELSFFTIMLSAVFVFKYFVTSIKLVTNVNTLFLRPQ